MKKTKPTRTNAVMSRLSLELGNYKDMYDTLLKNYGALGALSETLEYEVAEWERIANEAISDASEWKTRAREAERKLSNLVTIGD